MNPWKVSAQFAAFVWFTNRNKGKATSDDAVHFARENWVAFLPAADKGMGQLLIQVAKLPPSKGYKPPRQSPSPAKKGSRTHTARVA